MDLKNKPTVVITGASRGIGLGLTQGFLREGYRVVANARRMSMEESDDLAIVEGDVAEPETGGRLTQVAVERFGRMDVLINNAGIFVPKPFVDYSQEEFERVVGTNLAGFFYVTQPALRQMLKQQSGHVLTITTTLDEQPVKGVNAGLTNLTKGGLNSVTGSLAIEYAEAGIRVNAIAAGIIDTPMHEAKDHEFLKGLHPIRRLGSVAEIVDAALYLTSAQFVTGEVLYVDGGAHAGKW
ncbi:MAG: SDR family NAD(P)-dependent oxidoreductase [Acidobacteria bacterium]|nr:SDR family NAD(P)-dependent oxidoreductase [Acidobacteriota bacterium]